MTNAIHVLSTKPYTVSRNNPRFQQDDFEVVSTVLSALTWQKHNGSIKFFTDIKGAEYYNSLGLLDLWEGGVDTTTVENISNRIDQHIFWASAKLFALMSVHSPIAIIDTDLMVWKNLDSFFDNSCLTVLHREALIDCYLPKRQLKIPSGYDFNPNWNWRVWPCNTALAFFNDDNFKNYYLGQAVEFMTDNLERPLDLISQMVFVEQRLLAMCAKEKGISISTLVKTPFQKSNKLFTHLWGAKSIARHNPVQRERLIRSMMSKIQLISLDFHDRLVKCLDLKINY